MKKFFNCLLITIVIWTISRLIPAFISAIAPDSSLLRMVSFALMLPLGWLAANAISKGKHTACVRTNLYIFAFLEGIGISSLLTMVMELTYSTGRYGTNAYGVPYSEYPLIIIGGLCFVALYVGACFYLAKITTSKERKKITKRENVPEDIPELRKWWYNKNSLFVEFQSGSVKKYIDVPDKMYFALCNSPRKSKYLFEYIVGNFEMEQIKPGDKNETVDPPRQDNRTVPVKSASPQKPVDNSSVPNSPNPAAGKKTPWILRPVAWAVTIIMIFAMQLAAELICRLGDWLVYQLGGLSTIMIIFLVLMFGSAFVSLFFYSAFVLPSLFVSLSDKIYPSNHAFRYYFLGILEIAGCVFLVFAAIMGAVQGGSMFWFYARYAWLIFASVVMMIYGRSNAMARHEQK